jgi:hypothetical protein
MGGNRWALALCCLCCLLIFPAACRADLTERVTLSPAAAEGVLWVGGEASVERGPSWLSSPSLLSIAGPSRPPSIGPPRPVRRQTRQEARAYVWRVTR